MSAVGLLDELAALLTRGGLCMMAIAALGLVAYGLLAAHLLRLRLTDRPLAAARACHRDLTLIRACVGAAPLLGLLGTVTGMVITFEGLLSSGEVDAVAKGVGQALLTTQYGLMVAIPGTLLTGWLEQQASRALAQGVA